MKRSSYKYRCPWCDSTMVTNPREQTTGKWCRCLSCGCNFRVDE